MIGIRSITYHLPQAPEPGQLELVGRMSGKWDGRFSPIRTQRVCLPPLSEPAGTETFSKLSSLCDITSVRWFNVPIDPIASANPDKLFDFAYDILKKYGRAFVNVLAVKDKEIHSDVILRGADLIRKVSLADASGKDNFRLGLSINVAPNGPFFPFTYSSGETGFSIALELTQEINEILYKSKNQDLGTLREKIVSRLEPQIRTIETIALEIGAEFGVSFFGFDFSLAPIIEENGSIVPILNRLGVYDFGRSGTLFATGYLTNMLKLLASRFRSVGFSGVMFSLLEDFELCLINNARGIPIEQLIALSTMCGCGADMIPVCGSIRNEELRTLFLDVAAISCRLNKPLGFRVLPIPQCKRGEKAFTRFETDAEFIANTKVVDPKPNLMEKLGDAMRY